MAVGRLLQVAVVFNILTHLETMLVSLKRLCETQTSTHFLGSPEECAMIECSGKYPVVVPVGLDNLKPNTYAYIAEIPSEN